MSPLVTPLFDASSVSVLLMLERMDHPDSHSDPVSPGVEDFLVRYLPSLHGAVLPGRRS